MRRPVHVEGDRDRRPSEAWRDPRRQDARLRGAGGHARARRLRPTHSHTMAAATCVADLATPLKASSPTSAVTHEPLYTAAEMRAAEERYPGYPGSAGELMERAGGAVADEVLRAYPEARRIAAVCGGGANGGDGNRIAARILARVGPGRRGDGRPIERRPRARRALRNRFHGAPRPEAAAAIERINACGAPVVAVDLPSGVDASTGETAGAAVDADLTVTFHGRKVGLVVAPGAFTRVMSSSRTSGSRRRRPRFCARLLRFSTEFHAAARGTRSSRRARSSSSAARPGRRAPPC